MKEPEPAPRRSSAHKRQSQPRSGEKPRASTRKSKRYSERSIYAHARKSLARKQQKILHRQEDERRATISKQKQIGQAPVAQHNKSLAASKMLAPDQSWNTLSSIAPGRDNSQAYDSFLERMQDEKRSLLLKDMHM